MSEFISYDKSLDKDAKFSILEANARTLNNLQNEIKDPVVSIPVKTGVMPEESELQDFIPRERKVKMLDKNFLAFYEALIQIKPDDNFSENLWNLMDFTDYRFMSYIYMSKIKIFESIVLYSNMAFEDEQSVGDALGLIEELKALLVALDDALEEKVIIDESGQENDLYFLEMGNKLCFQESLLKDFPEDFYNRVAFILDSLRNGYIKNFKYLGAKRFFEARSDIVRVFFARIGANKYLILDVILKKKKSSISYWDYMDDLKNTLVSVRDEYASLAASDPEFTQKHLNAYLSIMETLKERNRG